LTKNWTESRRFLKAEQMKNEMESIINLHFDKIVYFNSVASTNVDCATSFIHIKYLRQYCYLTTLPISDLIPVLIE